MQPQVYHSPVYHSQGIQAWEQRWFAKHNSCYGLMQQVAWSISQQLITQLQVKKLHSIAVCCGQGNNAGDGYLIAKYLQQAGFQVDLYAAPLGTSADLLQARKEAELAGLMIYPHFDFSRDYHVYIDALFGIGLNRDLDLRWQEIIHNFNAQSGFKVAIDLPSGLAANTGKLLPVAIRADQTFSVLALKAGLLTGQGKAYSGDIHVVSVIPKDDKLHPIAHLTVSHIQLPKREATGHKGSYGHILVVGGHADMGGAVIMAAEAAFAAGAGKVTVVCDARHHTAILARAPNIMLRDINAINAVERQNLLHQVDAICFGMGLGRDLWAETQYQAWFDLIQTVNVEKVFDADALWFLAQYPAILAVNSYATPHPGEAASLLNIKTSDVEADRIAAIYALQQKYAGQWILKGAGSLILEKELYICRAGNAGMGTGGMGDVLAGMIASLKAQLHEKIQLNDIVALHAQAGDLLAEQGERGLRAQEMTHAVYRVVNA